MSKYFIANMIFEWLRAIVNTLVDLQSAGGRKGFETATAFVWSFTGMRACMGIQMSGLSE